MLRLAVKTGLAGGAVYYTREEGIWNENTDQVYERYSKALQPHLASVKQQIPVEVPALPTSGEVCFLTKHYWPLKVGASRKKKKKRRDDGFTEPNLNGIRQLSEANWNEGVKGTVYFIHRLPCYVGQWTKKGTDAIKKAMEPGAPEGASASVAAPVAAASPATKK